MKKLVGTILTIAISVTMAMSSLANGWYQGEDGLWRYQRKDGSMGSNLWAKSGDDWFYLKEDGTMAMNQWIETDGAYYYVDAKGAMMKNTITPDGYYVGVNGKWVPDQKKAESYTQPETITVGMQNALKTAQSYMRWSAFSKKRLYDQLKYEGFSDSEAKYGSETVEADWNEQCAKCAKSYMSWTGYSRKRLADQLEYEGFTNSQIAYGLAAVGY